jgi:hypothetical protein
MGFLEGFGFFLGGLFGHFGGVEEGVRGEVRGMDSFCFTVYRVVGSTYYLVICGIRFYG